MKELIRNEDGTVVVWVLLFIPLLLLFGIYGIGQTQMVTGADVDLQGAIDNAVKAAAGQITSDSQASGMPKINTVSAHDAFRAEISRNLGLNPITLSPLPGSFLANVPEYVFIVYNGDDVFSDGGAMKAVKYSFTNGVLSSGPLIAGGLPANFTIVGNDILLGSGGEVNITLDQPGVIAVIKEKQAMTAGNEEIFITRWGSAKVVKIQ